MSEWLRIFGLTQDDPLSTACLLVLYVIMLGSLAGIVVGFVGVFR